MRDGVMIYSLTCRIKVDPIEVQRRIDEMLADPKRVQDQGALVVRDSTLRSETEVVRKRLDTAPPAERPAIKDQLKQLTAGMKAVDLAQQALKALKLTDKLDLYSRAIELAPDWVFLYNNRGELYNLLGLHDQAQQDLDRALGGNKQIMQELYERGIKCLLDGDIQGAIRVLEQAAKLGHPDAQQALDRARSVNQQPPNLFNLIK